MICTSKHTHEKESWYIVPYQGYIRAARHRWWHQGRRHPSITGYRTTRCGIVLKSLPQCAIKLSMLEKEYEHNYVRTAMHHMQKWSKYTLMISLCTRWTMQTLHRVMKHFLNHHPLISAKKGLHVILAKGTRHVSYSFSWTSITQSGYGKPDTWN